MTFCWHLPVSADPPTVMVLFDIYMICITYSTVMVTMTTFCWHLAVSADPLSPPTVENLTAIGVCFPTCKSSSALETGPVKSVETLVWPFLQGVFMNSFTLLKTAALQYLDMSWVTWAKQWVKKWPLMGGLSNYFKVAESSCAFCMDHPLWNSLPDKNVWTKNWVALSNVATHNQKGSGHNCKKTLSQ